MGLSKWQRGALVGGMFGGPTGAVVGGIVANQRQGRDSPEPGGGLDPKYTQFAEQYGMSNALVRQKRDQMLAAYGPITATGPTANYQAPAEIAGDVQLQHDVAVQRYNQSLAQNAQGYLRQGLDLFQSYRPGGAASLASGQYGQLAQATLAGRLEPLDLMHEYRKEAADKAADRQKQAAQIQAAAQIIGTVVGAAAGGPAGAAVGGAAGNYLGGLASPTGGSGDVGYAGSGGAYSTMLQGGAYPGGAQQASARPMQAQQGRGTYEGPYSPAESQYDGGGGVQGSAGGGGTAQATLSGSGGVPGSQPSGRAGGGGAVSGGQAPPSGPMAMPSGPFTPSGQGSMGMTKEAVANNYEGRYGGAADTMWATYYAQNMLGFSDTMNARLDAMLAEDNIYATYGGSNLWESRMPDTESMGREWIDSYNQANRLGVRGMIRR